MLNYFLWFVLFAGLNLNNARNLNKVKDNILKHKITDDRVDFVILRQIWPEPTCMFPGVSFVEKFAQYYLKSCFFNKSNTLVQSQKMFQHGLYMDFGIFLFYLLKTQTYKFFVII
jgi:hypothetical protein